MSLFFKTLFVSQSTLQFDPKKKKTVDATMANAPIAALVFFEGPAMSL
jgi:hypothetical protein